MPSVSRVMSALTKLVGGFIVLVLVVYLATNLFSVVRGLHQRGQLTDDFTAEASSMLPGLRARQAELVDLVGREPDHARLEQVCAFGHDDSGWMINNYRERCGLRAVSAWRVDSAEEGRRVLSVTPPEYPVGDESCDHLGSLGGRSEVVIALAGRDSTRNCGDGLDYDAEARAVDGDAQALTGDATWLVVVENADDLIDADIGCAHWSVMFCHNPFIGHAWADTD